MPSHLPISPLTTIPLPLKLVSLLMEDPDETADYIDSYHFLRV